MPVAAGVLGYVTPSLAPERVAEAVTRSPWRGTPSATITTAIGAVHALGAARAGRYGHVGAVLHGRVDNLSDLARSLGTYPTDPCAVLAAAYLRYGGEFADQVLGDFSVLVLDDQRGVLIGGWD